MHGKLFKRMRQIYILLEYNSISGGSYVKTSILCSTYEGSYEKTEFSGSIVFYERAAAAVGFLFLTAGLFV